ncbi:site-2 protease family protein [Synechococcus sp. M16CYN]
MFQPRYTAAVEPIVLSWGFALLTTLLLFASVLLHELGHALMALREGVKVVSITLFHLGGIARVEKECSTAMGNLRIAAAGPIVSLLLALGMLLVAEALTVQQPLFTILFRQVGLLNLMLALFNLLPGLPLDGGLILKALVWKITGSQKRGVQVASALGRLLSTLMIVIGGLFLWQGAGVNGLLLILIGWFGLSANRSQSQILFLQKILQDLNVDQAAGHAFRVIEADQPLRRLSQMRLHAKENAGAADWVLVCKCGRWVGWIDDQPLLNLPIQQWDRQKVEDHMQPLDDLPSISCSAALWEAVGALEKSTEGRLLVLSAAGLPNATIDRSDVGDAVLKRLGITLPASFLSVARQQNSYPMGLVVLPQVVASIQAQSTDEETSEANS